MSNCVSCGDTIADGLKICPQCYILMKEGEFIRKLVEQRDKNE